MIDSYTGNAVDQWLINAQKASTQDKNAGEEIRTHTL